MSVCIHEPDMIPDPDEGYLCCKKCGIAYNSSSEKATIDYKTSCEMWQEKCSKLKGELQDIRAALRTSQDDYYFAIDRQKELQDKLKIWLHDPSNKQIEDLSTLLSLYQEALTELGGSKYFEEWMLQQEQSRSRKWEKK